MTIQFAIAGALPLLVSACEFSPYRESSAYCDVTSGGPGYDGNAGNVRREGYYRGGNERFENRDRDPNGVNRR
jgi:hypothetical protein